MGTWQKPPTKAKGGKSQDDGSGVHPTSAHVTCQMSTVSITGLIASLTENTTENKDHKQGRKQGPKTGTQNMTENRDHFEVFYGDCK